MSEPTDDERKQGRALVLAKWGSDPSSIEAHACAIGLAAQRARIVAALRKWLEWPQGEDGAHGDWDESDWSTPDKLADAIESGEL